MKRIHHIQQMGRNKIEHGDMIVRGRDEFSDDVQLARVVGNYGNRSRTLSYVTLVDLPVAKDWQQIMDAGFDFTQPSGVIDNSDSDFDVENYKE